MSDILNSIEGLLRPASPPPAESAPPIDPLPKLADVLRAVCEQHLVASDMNAWHDALHPWMVKAEITTLRRIAAFLGQLEVESACFSATVENLHYSAVRLCQVWPSRFPNIAAATPFAMQPEALADRVYSNRNGNGSEQSGDGWRFRGGGLIQLTGRANYEAFAATCGKSAEDAAAWVQTTKEGAAASACWFWTKHKLNAEADTWSVSEITRVINGGYMGAAQRLSMSNIALRAAGGS